VASAYKLRALERKRQIRVLAAQGKSYREILAEAGGSWAMIGLIVRDVRGGGRQPLPFLEWEPPPGQLSRAERDEISVRLAQDWSFADIGRLLGRDRSTIAREVGRNGGRVAYRPAKAHRQAYEQARRPKATKLEHEPLRRQVEEWLVEWWSPEQIARRLREEFPDDPMMWVSHETIYQSLFVQGRGELRRELARCLRTGRARRRVQGRPDQRGRIADMVTISERPAEVEDRAVPGHWEGDLLIGKDGKSAIATLVERSTRYVLLARIADQTAATVREAITAQILTLPEHLRRSLTWDQGREMAQHGQFSIDTNIAVYFCDPHSPWQRGSNENTNGLLRQYFPKGTDLSTHSQEQLNAVAASLNNRPRETLGWKKPAERLAELVAPTP
jgi:IS30 family transposase